MGADRVGETLALDYFGLHRIDDGEITFQLPYGEWIRLFRANGFVVEDLIELRPADPTPRAATATRVARLVAPLAVRGDLAAFAGRDAVTGPRSRRGIDQRPP